MDGFGFGQTQDALTYRRLCLHAGGATRVTNFFSTSQKFLARFRHLAPFGAQPALPLLEPDHDARQRKNCHDDA